MNRLPTERTGARQNFPSPRDGATVRETPPTLIWIGDGKAKEYTVKQLTEELNYNLDQCGYPHEEEEILAPMDLIQRYQEERASLNAEIDRVLAEITEKLGGVQL